MKHLQSFERLRHIVLLVAIASTFAVSAEGPAIVDEQPGDALRLRLGDLRQEMATTSVNFTDLDPRILRPRASSSSPATPPEGEVPFRKFRVLVDIGHGGRDLGAQGFFQVSEKELCLQIGKLVRQDLLRRGKVHDLPLEARLSRDSDRFLSLRERVRVANDWGADLFVSIHANASPYRRARGFEVYFLSSRATDGNATNLARFENEATGSGQPTLVSIDDASTSADTPLKADVLSMLADAQTTNHLEQSSHYAEAVHQTMSRELRANARGVRQGPFTVLAGTQMPSILVEVGYVTNPFEARLLKKGVYLKHLANAISKGIIEFADATGEHSPDHPRAQENPELFEKLASERITQSRK